MTKRIKEIIIVTGIIIVLFILLRYFKDKVIISLGGYTTQEVTTVIDSTFIKGRIDTLEVFNHYVETKGIILNPKAKIVYIKNPVTEEIGDSIKEFDVIVKDSLIEGKFTIQNKFNGDLKNSVFNYKPLFPKYITRVDTVKINTSTTQVLTNKRSLLGIGVGYSNLQYLSIQGSYITKNNLQFIYEYGKPLNKTIEIINGTPIQFQTDDLHSIKIIKHF